MENDAGDGQWKYENKQKNNNEQDDEECKREESKSLRKKERETFSWKDEWEMKEKQN